MLDRKVPSLVRPPIGSGQRRLVLRQGGGVAVPGTSSGAPSYGAEEKNLAAAVYVQPQRA
ncbi:hypothetical protein [Actinoallomurus acaciae]|uniref:hypothetical protein n=1 Tax=Actinoallomurus acaciae TaxID=502577 RepID=UPI0036731EE1